MILPAGLLSRTFGSCFNNTFDNLTWAGGAQSRARGGCFDQPFGYVSISIKHSFTWLLFMFMDWHCLYFIIEYCRLIRINAGHTLV